MSKIGKILIYATVVIMYSHKQIGQTVQPKISLLLFAISFAAFGRITSWYILKHLNLSRLVRKLDFCICENKDADQLRGNREADQRLCFRYTDSTISLLPKYEISSLQPSSVAVQPGLCGAWSETPKTGFLTTRLI